jgi:diguanylate cyclase (GGDEF)-like protein
MHTQIEPEITVQMHVCALPSTHPRPTLQVIVRNLTPEKLNRAVAHAYMAELKKLNEKLERLSLTDELTQLHNLRALRTKLKEEQARSLRYHGKYSVLLLDVDHFKHYNDTQGHPAGDQLLQTLGKLLKEQCRSTDFAARYGGEEFLILCPEINHARALVHAERYRKLIETCREMNAITVSIGVASFPESGLTADEVIQAADQALYLSKQNGRNQTTAFSATPATELLHPHLRVP